MKGKYFQALDEDPPMDRRTLLLSAGIVSIGLTAGCLSESKTDFSLRVVDRDFGAGPDGNLTVWVTVSNPGNEAQSGTVYVTAELNDDSIVRVREVALSAHETTEIEISYDVSYQNITNFNMDSSVEPPE